MKQYLVDMDCIVTRTVRVTASDEDEAERMAIRGMGAVEGESENDYSVLSVQEDGD